MGLAHVTYVFSIPGPKRATINLDFEELTDFGTTDLDALTDAASDDWALSTGFKSVVSSVNSLVQVEAFAYHLEPHIPTPTDPRLFQRVVDVERRIQLVGTAGTLAGTALPPMCSTGVTFR